MRRVLIIGLLVLGAAACAPVTVPITNDTSPPQLVSGSVNPNPVVAGDTVTVTWRLIDATGVALTGVVLSNPTTNTTIVGCLNTQQVSGTPNDGIYTASCQIPALAPGGNYVADVHSADLQGNTGEDTTLTFLVSGGAGDVSAPALVSAAVTPNPATVGAVVTATWHLTDASGVGLTTVSLRNHLSGTSVCAGPGTLTTGMATDGTYTASCQLAAGTASGSYDIVVQSTDVLGNTGTDASATFTVS